MAHVTLNFTVLGKPRPAGSKRAIPIKRGGVFTGKVAVKDDSTHGKPWRDSVAYAAQEAMSEGDHELLTGPLGLGLTFYVARPASHYTKAQHKISRGAPRRPVTRPDLTKYIRAVEDACTSIIWRDDAQIVTQVARKFYGSPERCEVVVQTSNYDAEVEE